MSTVDVQGEISRIRGEMLKYAGHDDSPPARLCRTMLELCSRIDAGQIALEKKLGEAHRAFTPADLQILADQLVVSMDDVLLHRWARFNQRALGIGTVLLLLVVAVAAYAVWHLPGPMLAGLRAGPDNCIDRPDKSQICYIPVWTKLPPTPAPRGDR